MVGKEIADAIAPIVMWVAIVGGVLMVLYLIKRVIAKGAVAKDDLEEVTDAEKYEKKMRKRLLQNRTRLRALWRSHRVHND